MTQELSILLITAASIGFLHTIAGPDHYIPFIVIAKARKWSILKTACITAICGVGHVASSVILGAVGVIFGIGLSKLKLFEASRGEIAAWLMITFGLLYLAYGIRNIYKNKPHEHLHVHSDGSVHTHEHSHTDEHAHVHSENSKSNITPWILFLIFVFGPCEVLIPMLMYPAAQNNIPDTVLVTLVFSLTTILTMLSVVLISSFGISFIKLGKIEKYTHAIAGATIALSGVCIKFLGL